MPNILMTGTDEINGNSSKEITVNLGLVLDEDRVFLQAIDCQNCQLFSTNVKDGKFKVNCIQFEKELKTIKFNYLICRN